MWDTFPADLLIAFIGALLTVAIAYGTYLLQQRRLEIQAVRGLINDFHHRRSVSITAPRTVRGARDLADFQRATASVIDMRDHVKRVRDQVRHDSDAQIWLSRIIRACNRYLEEGEIAPDDYLFLLSQLRQELLEEVRELCSGPRGLDALEPGAAAF
ncbi:hypothetical protein GCM10027404_09580 [Arthrobacter tumbae]|uniref:hypothetical protein n=1 Tax=Arthrobacter tumbae TaxID=163874 RepID=UPI00195B1CFB|nr:hypothetical protein [Arthrobacter tumbae]MBM7782240.1 cell division protein YceG involved in septum cleavage [Arthrobacter tumbae]